MKEQLEKIRQEALDALNAVGDSNELESLRVRFLGKKGELTAVLKTMGKLSAEERPVMGQMANNVRAAIEEKLEEAKTTLKAKALEQKLEAEAPTDNFNHEVKLKSFLVSMIKRSSFTVFCWGFVFL